MGKRFWAICFVLVVSACLGGTVFGQEVSSSQSEPLLDLKSLDMSGSAEAGLEDPSGGSLAYKLLTGVPAYNWYHGCGPTAAASIIGYYELRGYGNLFAASGWDQVSLTANVQDEISSPAHNAKYDPHPDNYSLPAPPYTSIADWFQTSVNQPFGWSYLSRADDAFTGYVGYKGYECTATNLTYGTQGLNWYTLVAEIDAGRPMMFLVDTDADGSSDHFVPVFGYDDRGPSAKYYACYDTWSEDETVRWYRFTTMGIAWGVGYGTTIQVTPEPGTVALLAIGGCLALLRRKRSVLRQID